ncbi:MAG: CotH kinase family protein [Crocinitomicaceae bacterium]|nr:CotH kinase family protein [Crocinitomicaceae bacterium]
MKYWIFMLLVISLLSCGEEVQPEPFAQMVIECDAETVSGNKFIAGQELLAGAETQSSDYSRSGNYSVKLDVTAPFAFGYVFTNIKEGDVIEVSAWRYLEGGIGSLVISDYDSENGVSERSDIVHKEDNGWGLMKCLFVASKDFDSIVTYALNSSDEPAYFDDFEIRAFFNNSKPDDSFDGLEITISDSIYDTLVERRKIALDQGVITADLKEYVKASLTIDGEKVPVDLRLKGDWPDHLETNKWSFRIKIKGNNAFRGMKSFSIQNPNTRSFMNEWFAHKLYEQEDILTTRYIFVPVIINGEKKGVYALEEHFDKQLLEYRERREGPIVKFDESGVWQVNLYQNEEGTYYNVPLLASAEIVPFKKNRTKRSLVLSQQLKTAQWLMNRYRNHDPFVGEYFDVEAAAKLIALTDVINGKHGQIWHNQRLYFNPVTNKLEPIAYDCFGEQNSTERKVEITGLKRENKVHFTLFEFLLTNPEVEEMYLSYLKEYTDSKFMEQALKSLQNEINAVQELLHFEYPNCALEIDIFKENCTKLKEQLPEYEQFIESPSEEGNPQEPFRTLPKNVLFTDVALKAYVRDTNDYGKYRVDLQNFHSSELRVFAYALKGNRDSLIPLVEVSIAAYNGSTDEQLLRLEEKPKWIYYRASNCGSKIFRYKVGKWDKPERVQHIKKNTNVMVPRIGEEGLIVFRGTQEFHSDVVVNQGMRVIFEPGTKVNFTNGASFVSYSPVDFEGTEDHPVHIFSSDGTANGFTVISNEESSLTYVKFENLNTMRKNNWILTGAVTFYEGKIDIDNCEFLDNNCEDGLNLIRCEFEMTNSTIENTFSDGFDADFCIGTVDNCYFENTGNDAADFSGSKVTIKNCTILNAGDKGISGGENSTLIIENTSIDGANIAIAAKDLSKLFVSHSTVSNSNVVFAAFRKKPEYGPALIEAEKMTLLDNKKERLLELRSKLILDGKEHVGTESFDIEEMYADFQKTFIPKKRGPINPNVE